MSDLVAFLRARLDEDEQTARRAEPNQAPVQLRAMVTREGSDPFLVIDSARVLAEVETKRRIIDGCVETLATEDAWDPVLDGGTSEPYDLARFVLKLLALPYADHPSYDEAWRP